MKTPIALLFVLLLFLSGCAVARAPVSGFLYTNVKGPVLATQRPMSPKVGTAEAKSILGLIAIGDASIQEAAQKAGITRISHVDYEAYSILGIYASYTVYVYGE